MTEEKGNFGREQNDEKKNNGFSAIHGVWHHFYSVPDSIEYLGNKADGFRAVASDRWALDFPCFLYRQRYCMRGMD